MHIGQHPLRLFIDEFCVVSHFADAIHVRSNVIQGGNLVKFCLNAIYLAHT